VQNHQQFSVVDVGLLDTCNVAKEHVIQQSQWFFEFRFEVDALHLLSDEVIDKILVFNDSIVYFGLLIYYIVDPPNEKSVGTFIFIVIFVEFSLD